MHFAVDWVGLWMVLVLLVPLVILKWLQRTKPIPHVNFSNLHDLKASNQSWRIRYGNLPHFSYYLALCCLILAFIDPRYDLEKPQEKKGMKGKALPLATEGIAIYLVLDQSGSMAGQVVVNNPSSHTTLPSKIELLKQVSRNFIQGDTELGLQGRDSDLIGLVTFARTARVIIPLTFDHEAIVNELTKLDVVKHKQQDGTAIGYAIYKTASLIAASKHYSQQLVKEGKPAYDLKGAVIILVTDGFQSPHPDDKGNRSRTMGIEEAAQFAKEQGIRLYMINIDPAINDEEYAPQRRLMTRAAQSTGGRFYPVEDSNQLQSIYAEIDRIEKSVLPQEGLIEPKQINRNHLSTQYRHFSFYPFLIITALTILCVGILLETCIFRRVP